MAKTKTVVVPVGTPEVIYIQVGEDIDRDARFKDLVEVTWCADRIYDTDLEYRLVRKARVKR